MEPISISRCADGYASCGTSLRRPHASGASSRPGIIVRMSSLAWRVGELAEQRGFNTRRLAKAAGLDEKTVRNIIAGRATRVDLDTVARLSSTLGVAPGALWTSRPDPTEAWMATAGAAGQAQAGELDDLLAGRAASSDSALERATRPQ